MLFVLFCHSSLKFVTLNDQSSFTENTVFKNLIKDYTIKTTAAIDQPASFAFLAFIKADRKREEKR